MAGASFSASRNRIEIALLIAVAALWAWFALLSAVDLDTSGLWGSVTMLLWIVYLLGVPVFLLGVLGAAFLSAFIERTSVTRLLGDLALAGVTAALWYWSFYARFDFLAR